MYLSPNAATLLLIQQSRMITMETKKSKTIQPPRLRFMQSDQYNSEYINGGRTLSKCAHSANYTPPTALVVINSRQCQECIMASWLAVQSGNNTVPVLKSWRFSRWTQRNISEQLWEIQFSKLAKTSDWFCGTIAMCRISYWKPTLAFSSLFDIRMQKITWYDLEINLQNVFIFLNWIINCLMRLILQKV